MSVLPMKRVLICALKKDRKEILEFLQRQGACEIHSTLACDDVFMRQDKTQAAATYHRSAEQCEQALTVLGEHAPEKSGLLSMLDGKTAISDDEFEERIKSVNDAMQDVSSILAYDKKCTDAKAEIPRIESQVVALEPWLGYDLPLDFDGTKASAVFTGTLPGDLTFDQAEAMIKEQAPEVDDLDVNVISSAPEQTCLYIICGRKHEDEVREALRKLNFAKPPASSTNPVEAKTGLEERLGELNNILTTNDAKIKELAVEREKIRFASDYYRLRADKYDVLSQLSQSRVTFIVEAYIEERYCDSLGKYMNEKFDLIFETEDPAPDEEPPVALKNNGFVSPVESVVESYSLPTKHEFDPSTLVSIFYYFLFGMMLSDAGYGIIIVIATSLALLKKKNMGEGMKRTMKMFLYCGISTTFWGFMFGSFFGDAVNVIATTFFGRPDIKLSPIWFDQLDSPMRMLSFCFLVGIIHLFVGLGAKAYGCFKNHDPLGALYDCIFWYMLVGGAIFYLLTLPMMSSMLGIATLSAGVGKVAGVVAIIGLIGVILTGGRESHNWFKRILKGLYSAYGITSWLSDILSYSRLLALGLATGVIAQVFNKMGSMVATGTGLIGVIFFIIIFIIGHTLNLLINALGAYVHTNRLEYVEFFGKFYDGGGKAFEPFKQNTKYFTIKEEL